MIVVQPNKIQLTFRLLKELNVITFGRIYSAFLNDISLVLNTHCHTCTLCFI